jgi:hypothetical protein
MMVLLAGFIELLCLLFVVVVFLVEHPRLQIVQGPSYS